MKEFNIKNGQTAFVVALSIILALLIFKLGIFVGSHQARFSMVRPNFSLETEFPGGHGAVGRVVGVSLPNFIVAGPDNFERRVFIGSSTMIRQIHGGGMPGDIGVDSFVSVLGNPNASGTIEAKFIRIMPR